MSVLLKQATDIQSKIPEGLPVRAVLCENGDYENFTYIRNVKDYDLSRLNPPQLQSFVTKFNEMINPSDGEKKLSDKEQKMKNARESRGKKPGKKGKPQPSNQKGEKRQGKNLKSKKGKDGKEKGKGGAPNQRDSFEMLMRQMMSESMGAGSYTEIDESTRNHHELAQQIMDLNSTVERKKQVNYRGLFPFYLSNPSKIFPHQLKRTQTEPILLMRSRLTHYLNPFMISLLNSWSDLAKANNWKVYKYSSLRGELTYEGKWANYETLLALPPTKILMPGCLCSGGSFDVNVWKQIAEHHELIVMTFYQKGAHCGCNTFERMRKSTPKIRIIHSMSDDNPHGVED